VSGLCSWNDFGFNRLQRVWSEPSIRGRNWRVRVVSVWVECFGGVSDMCFDGREFLELIRHPLPSRAYDSSN
jgi:hypothetical protein